MFFVSKVRSRALALGALSLGAVMVLSGCGSDDTEAVAASPAASPSMTSSVTPSVTPPAVVVSSAPAEPAKESAPAPAPVPVAPEPQPAYGTYPPEEQAFLDAFQHGKAQYEGASTELQRSVALTDRDAAMCAASNNGTMANWVGKIVNIGANNDGLATVEIELSEGVKIQTWNNAFSDITDNTLIPSSAPFFSTLVGMTEGALVTFSADSVPSDTSCLKKANLTDAFYAIDPNFIVRFSDVRLQ